MKVFVSYSYRPENAWVEDYAIPLVRHLGHEPVTGRILGGGGIPDEVRRRMRACKGVVCFATRADPIFDAKGATGRFRPPDWVRDELITARAQDREAVEFREAGVEYGGAAGFSAWHEFDRDRLPAALLRLAEVVSQWPVAPLTLRLSLPPTLHAEFEAAFDAGLVEAECVAEDLEGNEVLRETALKVRALDGGFVVNLWLKADANLAVSLRVRADARRLVAKGVSPSVCVVPLRAVGGGALP